MEEVKTYALHHYYLSNRQGQAGSTLPKKAFTKVATVLVKVAPVDLCPCTGP